MTTQVTIATVREYQEFAARFTDWDLTNGDVKSFQRPWMVAKLGELVPRGGKILEYGAGDCVVAGRLSALGYDVWVADPYDGSGGGPSDWRAFQRRYPEVHFVPSVLHPDLDLPEDFDAVCSVSVLEHVPCEEQRKLWEAIERYTRKGGYSLDAVDFSVRGPILVDFPLIDEILRLRSANVDASRLAAGALADPDTYYLSPAMHRRWRKARSYSEYPFRQVTSLNIVRRL